ncbi:MAG: hypothetical protein F4227_00890 [Gammaproteobacteria bacterium]|nr:hypothetical protein [Gammaproteobacteria bacterium]MYF01566.1 hypothetical protein [Gammaproteobacteria bacterium]MYI77927.1 hypothetical protein [Gammaproteobacteria bacterium]
MDNHINDINPYLWGAGDKKGSFAFIVLENPLTFGRLFADPEGDFTRVQDALDRPRVHIETQQRVKLGADRILSC